MPRTKKRPRSANGILAGIKGYFRENWGALFIVWFMLLLVVAAASLALGLDMLAEKASVVAYYALVVGVVLQLACFLKYGEGSGNKE